MGRVRSGARPVGGGTRAPRSSRRSMRRDRPGLDRRGGLGHGAALRAAVPRRPGHCAGPGGRDVRRLRLHRGADRRDGRCGAQARRLSGRLARADRVPHRTGPDRRRMDASRTHECTERGTPRVTSHRDLDWDGCYNVRDLGGLPTMDGRLTRHGALVRADAPSGLTAAGWAAVLDHGVNTVIDLMEVHERQPDAAPRPAGLTDVHVPLDGTDDDDFWAPLRENGHWGTVLYYRPYLQRFPHRVAAAVRAFADAPPGGVLVHCGRGRDRTGMVCMLL